MKVLQFVNTTPEDFKKELGEIIDSKLKQFHQHFQPKEPEEYIPRKELALRLSISEATLWRYTKNGTFTAYGIGKRVFYKLSEVNDSICELKQMKSS